MRRQVCVVVPAWNEEDVIGRVVEDVAREVVARLDSAELVVVDDCSTDRTPEILAELAASTPSLRVVRLERNAGHGAAVLEGLRRSDADWIFQLDSDGQFVVAEFWKLWQRRESADLVLGVRAHRRDPAHRLLLSRVVAAVVSVLSRRRLRDPNVPFRLIRRSLWDDWHRSCRGTLAPSILTVVGAAVRGWRIAQVPVTHLARASSSSLVSWRLVRFSLRGLGQLIRFRAQLARAPARVERE